MKIQENISTILKHEETSFRGAFLWKLVCKDVNSINILKSSWPVCGYLTLDERNMSDIGQQNELLNFPAENKVYGLETIFNR